MCDPSVCWQPLERTRRHSFVQVCKVNHNDITVFAVIVLCVCCTGQESGDTQGPWCSDSHGVEAAVRGAMSAGQKRAGDSGGTLLVVHVGRQVSRI